MKRQARLNRYEAKILNVDAKLRRRLMPISPLEGKMSGRTEGGSHGLHPARCKKGGTPSATYTHPTKNSIRPALPSDTVGRETKD